MEYKCYDNWDQLGNYTNLDTLELIPEYESDFQIWDMQQNYTGNVNIRAKKTTPTDVLKDINLDQVPKTHQSRLNDIFRKFAPTVLSYDKTDSNILHNHVFDLQLIPVTKLPCPTPMMRMRYKIPPWGKR